MRERESRYDQPEHPGVPYAIGSDTSLEAAQAKAKNVQHQRADVYLCILRAGENGRTWDEIVEILGCSPTANGRITELRDTFRLIVDSGRRRKTRSGGSAAVYVVAPQREG